MDFSFTYQRNQDGEIEERTVDFEEPDFDTAMERSDEFCRRSKCLLVRLEWMEDGFRQRSAVQYT